MAREKTINREKSKPVESGPWHDAWLADRELAGLAGLVGGLKAEEPPFGLAEAVLGAVEPKRPSLWRRFWLSISRPRTVTIAPLRLLPAAALLLLLTAVPLLLLHEQTPVPHTAAVAQPVPVVFTFQGTAASSVQVIGSFNLWNPEGYEMKADPERGGWTLEVRLPAGRYEYSFLIDGERVAADPGAVFTKDDGFGNLNSVIYIGDGANI